MPRAGTGSYIEGWTVKSDDDRISIIRGLAFQAIESKDAGVVLWTARAVTAHCPPQDDRCELEAIYQAVRSGPLPVNLNGQVVVAPGLRFVMDSRWTDIHSTARTTLEWAAQGSNGGDCDDHVILVTSLLLVLGWVPGAVIASKDGRTFDHVFPVAGFPKDNPNIWVPLDTTPGPRGVGWWPPRSFVKRMRVYGFTASPQVIGREIQ